MKMIEHMSNKCVHNSFILFVGAGVKHVCIPFSLVFSPSQACSAPSGLTSFFTPLIDIINSYRGDVGQLNDGFWELVWFSNVVLKSRWIK